MLNDHLYDKYQTSANSTRPKTEMIVIYIFLKHMNMHV